MSIGGIQGNGHGLHALGKAHGSQGAQGGDLKVKQLEQELSQIEEGMKLAAMTGNGQLLAMLQQQLQGMQQSAESGAGQDMGGQRGGGRAQGFDARQKLDEFQQKAEVLAQEIQMQLQSVQAQSGNQSSQGSGFQDQNQAQGRNMRSLYPM
jgi:hypothetical protein